MKNDKKPVGAAYMIWLLLGVTFLLVGLSQKNRTFIVLGWPFPHSWRRWPSTYDKSPACCRHSGCAANTEYPLPPAIILSTAL